MAPPPYLNPSPAHSIHRRVGDATQGCNPVADATFSVMLLFRGMVILPLLGPSLSHSPRPTPAMGEREGEGVETLARVEQTELLCCLKNKKNLYL
jgi:hypothetical protein